MDDLFQTLTDQRVARSPNLAVRTQYFEGQKQDDLSRRLTPRTEAWRREGVEAARLGLGELAAFDREAMTDTQRLSADVLEWYLQSLVEGAPFLDYDYPLQQMNGANVSVPTTLTVSHPIRNERDAENYVARLAEAGERMVEATAESERQARSGVLPPSFILDSTIAQMENFISRPPGENPLTTTLRRKMSALPDLSAERQEALASEAARLVETEVYPAWRKAIAALQSQLPDSTDDAGLWRFENGAELYAQRLRYFTSTDLTADQIHEIGLAEVARIETRMDDLLREIGYSEGSITQRVEEARADLAYADTDEGRDEIMTDIDAILEDALERTAALFDLQPAAAVVARPYPEFRWASAAASYSAPPLDGSREAVFQMPLRPSRLTKFALRSLVYHETVPGHHFQLALSIENSELPSFRRISAFGGLSASVEGWALYAERLAAEEGWYEDDLSGHIGQLNSALFRARRLVVDTGLHAKRWTRQQAIDFGIEPSEVERYVVFPGQACSYMIGQLKIVELRERAREALGDGFELREFHTLVLETGVVPLSILERVVDDFIAEGTSR